MNKYSSNNMRLMLYANLINVFGSALTWTGLPLLVANQSNNPYDSSIMFLTATAAMILFSFIGGALSDRVSRKKMYFWSSAISILIMGILFLYQFSTSGYLILFFVSSAAGSFQASAIGPWFSDIVVDMDQQTNKLLAKKSSFMMVGKLVGMAAGPLLYEYLGRDGLIIDALTSVIELVLLIQVPFIAASLSAEKMKSYFIPKFAEIKEHSRLIVLQSSTSILSFPIIALGVINLKSVFQSDPEYISIYWLIGSVGSLCVNLLMSKGKVLDIPTKLRMYVFTGIFSLSLVLMSLSVRVEYLLAAFILMTLSNPVLNNFINTTVVTNTEKHNRGKVYAYCDSVSQIFVLLALGLIHGSEDMINAQNIYLFFIPLALFRLKTIIKFDSTASLKS